MKFAMLAVALAAPALASPTRNARDLSQWSQCGGMNYSGSTVCAAGLVCVYQNAYYSQCNVASSSQAPAPTSTSAVQPASSSSVVIKSTSTTAVTSSVTTKVSPPSSTTSTSASSTSAALAPTSTSVLGPLTQGSATSYGGNWPGGACSFSDYPHIDTNGASFNGFAAGGQLWNNAGGCGSCVSVTGPNNQSVIAMLMDECPECATTHLDLDTHWASEIAANGGIFDIAYQAVPCPVPGNLEYKNKDGSSQYYFALQVRNSVVPIATLEVSTDGGASWTPVTLSAYNFFTYTAGFGSVVDLRITATTGASIVEKGIAIASGTIVQGTQQFSA